VPAGALQADLDPAALRVSADEFDIASVGSEHRPDMLEDSADPGGEIGGDVGHGQLGAQGLDGSGWIAFSDQRQYAINLPGI